MDIKCESWDADIQYLSGLNNLITTAKVFTQALIHSNLFGAHQSQHGELKNLTLSDMAEKNTRNRLFVLSLEV